MENIGKKIAAGVAYNTLFRILIVVVQGVTSIFLARILSSADYGVITFAAIFVGFLSQFSDFGLGNALVQKKEINQSILNTAFTLRNIVAFVLVLIALIISFIVPHFFDYPNIEWVIRLMAFNFILNSMGFVSAALLKREMNFFGTNLAILVSAMAGSIVAISLAYSGYGFWSLVWSNVLSSAMYVIAIRLIKPINLNYEINKVAAHEMWRFGSYILISGFLIYALFNGANFVVGAVQGAVALGFFSLALDWGTKVPTVLSQTVLSVLFPAFSIIRDDEEKIKTTYVESVKYIAFFSILVNLTLIFISEDFLRSVLGDGTDKWMPALNTFRIMCLYGIIRAILEPIGNLLMAFGETKVLFKANLFAALIQILLLYPVIRLYGIDGVAILVLITYGAQYLVYLPFLNTRFAIRPILFARAIFPSLFSVITFFGATLLLGNMTTGVPLPDILIKAFVYMGLYVVLFGYMTKWKLAGDIVRMVR